MGIKNIKDSLTMKSKSYLSIEKNVTKSEKTIHFKYCVQHKTCLNKFYKKYFLWVENPFSRTGVKHLKTFKKLIIFG